MASTAMLFGSGSASAQALAAEAMARAPAVTRVAMSPDGRALIGIVADPRNPDEPALASWDISSIDAGKPLAPASVTPSDGRMTFLGARIYKTGKVVVVANQPWTGALNGCGEGKTTGSTKTYVQKAFLTDTSIRKFDDLLAKAPTTGVSAATLRCLELATSPSIIDLPLDPENVIVQRLDTTSLEVALSQGQPEDRPYRKPLSRHRRTADRPHRSARWNRAHEGQDQSDR